MAGGRHGWVWSWWWALGLRQPRCLPESLGQTFLESLWPPRLKNLAVQVSGHREGLGLWLPSEGGRDTSCVRREQGNGLASLAAELQVKRGSFYNSCIYGSFKSLRVNVGFRHTQRDVCRYTFSYRWIHACIYALTHFKIPEFYRFAILS